MKRLALFLGVLGAITGGVASYLVLSDVLATRARHNAFEQLANSEVVQQQRKLLQIDFSAGLVPKQLPPLPRGATYDRQAVTPPASRPQQPAAAPNDWQTVPAGPQATAATGIAPAPPPLTFDMSTFQPLPSEVDKGGIKTIHWTKAYGVESIDTVDGRTVLPEPAPSFWQYILPSVFPVLGFFIPWGLVTAVVWVGSGFFERAK